MQFYSNIPLTCIATDFIARRSPMTFLSFFLIFSCTSQVILPASTFWTSTNIKCDGNIYTSPTSSQKHSNGKTWLVYYKFTLVMQQTVYAFGRYLRKMSSKYHRMGFFFTKYTCINSDIVIIYLNWKNMIKVIETTVKWTTTRYVFLSFELFQAICWLSYNTYWILWVPSWCCSPVVADMCKNISRRVQMTEPHTDWSVVESCGTTWPPGWW